jgi:hypothetical protein
MPKRFYLATKKDRAIEANKLADALKGHGWERTFTWNDQTNAGPESRAKLAEIITFPRPVSYPIKKGSQPPTLACPKVASAHSNYPATKIKKPLEGAFESHTKSQKT